MFGRQLLDSTLGCFSTGLGNVDVQNASLTNFFNNKTSFIKEIPSGIYGTISLVNAGLCVLLLRT